MEPESRIASRPSTRRRMAIMLGSVGLLLGLLVAFSRVALSVHYLGDVVMGSYVGIIAAILMHRAFAAKGIEVKL